MHQRQAICVLLLFALTFAPQIDRAEGDVWATVVPILVKKLSSLWRNGQLEFLGHQCEYSVRPRVRRWKLYFYGHMSCPSLGGLSVTHRTQSRSKVVERTMEAFVKDAVRKRLITESQAKQWMKN
ncbi:anti-lipopolysaccharide factor-like [Oratosquilla oratoria]|uniref:anti-lipopolysaccharide factor-like n=1 Tax=Oratosquilla oratoria TaxID=337810 RepID=UPI003F762BCC